MADITSPSGYCYLPDGFIGFYGWYLLNFVVVPVFVVGCLSSGLSVQLLAFLLFERLGGIFGCGWKCLRHFLMVLTVDFSEGVGFFGLMCVECLHSDGVFFLREYAFQ